MELIDNQPDGFKVEPVYLTNEGGEWHYQYARLYTCKILGIQQVNLQDMPIDIDRGDVFYGLDFFPSGVIEAAKLGIYSKWKAVGLSINFLVYDLLPILKPEFFPDDVDILHSTWLKVISLHSSRLICISNATADELRLWLKKNMPVHGNQPMIGSIHLGADIDASLPSMGFSDDVKHFLNTISAVPTFVMVSTLEPRKGYLQTLAAFDLLWKQGHQINLLIVGKEGWMFLPDDRRRTIPELVKKIRGHAEYKRHLFWLESASDEFLEKIYSASICLIFASEGEGFGLPLIEAARHGLPIIARDIPVFREVAGEHAFYFDGLKPSDLSAAISDWLELNTKGKAPQSTNMSWLTWRQSTQLLLENILSKSSVYGLNKGQQTSIITDQNEKIPFRKYGRSPYFRKLMYMFISMALRSRFKKPLKRIYFALGLDKIIY
jgi:glycosyltransferase involved in cell wall biosynthesis